jgi:hypothetical protein
MKRLVFLLEEPSMKNLLLELMPRLFPGYIYQKHFLCIAHEGKSDLDKSIPRKLSSWKIPDDIFIIVRDNDNAICTDIKNRFVNICHINGRPDTLVRLVCQELESWYIGDLEALAMAFNDSKLSNPKNKKKFINPDTWQKPSVELARMIPTFQKGSAATRMGQYLNVDENKNQSESFRFFVQGVRRLIA